MTPIVKLYESPSPINTREVLRYMGARQDDAQTLRRVLSAIADLQNRLVYRTVYAVFPVAVCTSEVSFPFCTVRSVSLATRMQGCTYAVCMAATVGDAPARLMERAKDEPLTALAYQAIGSERIEALCNALESDIKTGARRQGYRARPRFSPGYGDLPLAFQKDMFRVLDCPIKIGLSLRDTLMMTPTKSVSAIIGILPNERNTL